MNQRFGAAVSEHPLITHTTGEVVGQVLDAVGEAPDLAVLFVTAPNVGAIEDICSAVRETLAPRVLLGVSAVSVIGNQREVEDSAAISLWAGRVDGAVPVRLDGSRSADGWTISGFPSDPPDGTLVLFTDPFSFPADGLLEHLADHAPDLDIIGGLASGSTMPGGNRLVVDADVYSDGAVGVLLPRGVTRTLVSQGCRPVGEPFTVTGAQHNLITELGGRPALERLEEMIAGESDDTRALLQRGLHIGIVVDEQQLDFRRGDFLVRAVMGVDRAAGSVAVGQAVAVGQTVQFHVRDAATADEDLRELLHGRAAAAALVFTCTGRGSRLFEERDHDAAIVYESLGSVPVAGFFCAGEIGPVGDRNHLHGFTASVVMFD